MENVASYRNKGSGHDGSGGKPVRVDWVDYAKGFCIVLVVMMHSTLGVGIKMEGTGWLHAVVEFARPFRMPDFFLISGLFLARVIDRNWRLYLDRKVVHFFYFYVLWVAIQFAFKAPVQFAMGDSVPTIVSSYLMTFIEPFGTLWFIYLLPVFFVVTKLARRLPWYVLIGFAALLQILPVHTGWTTIDEFASRYVFFLSGYLFAPAIFRFAAWAMDNPAKSTLALLFWALVNGGLVIAGFSKLPFVALALGGMGACAVVLVSSLLSRLNFMRFLRYLGEHSIVVYLAFFLPMVITRLLLARFLPQLDIGTMSAIVTFFGVLVPVIWYKMVQITGIGGFLFKRPSWAHIVETPEMSKAVPFPAE